MDRARFSSTVDFDSTTQSVIGKIQNMVVYGSPTGGSTPLVKGLALTNVSVTWSADTAGIPQTMTVALVNYTCDAVFQTFAWNNKPAVTVRYMGVYKIDRASSRNAAAARFHAHRRCADSAGFRLHLIGVIDLGQVLFFHLMLADRVRAGARFAVVNNYDTAAITNMVVYNGATAPGGGDTGLFGLTTSMVSVNRYDTGTSADRIEVDISNFPIAFYSPRLAGPVSPRTFHSIMPVESLGASQ